MTGTFNSFIANSDIQSGNGKCWLSPTRSSHLCCPRARE